MQEGSSLSLESTCTRRIYLWWLKAKQIAGTSAQRLKFTKAKHQTSTRLYRRRGYRNLRISVLEQGFEDVLKLL